MRGRSPCPQIHCAALSHLHTSLLSHRVLPRAMRCINSSLSNSSFLSTALSRLPTLKKVLTRLGYIKRLIVVADRGLLSLDNIDELGKIKLPSGQALEFILAVPGRRYAEFVEVLQAFQGRAVVAEQEIVEETSWHGLRLVVAHHPQRAKEQTLLRQERIAALQTQAQDWVGKLEGQDSGQASRGRKLSDSGAKARRYHEPAVRCRRGAPWRF